MYIENYFEQNALQPGVRKRVAKKPVTDLFLKYGQKIIYLKKKKENLRSWKMSRNVQLKTRFFLLIVLCPM